MFYAETKADWAISPFRSPHFACANCSATRLWRFGKRPHYFTCLPLMP